MTSARTWDWADFNGDLDLELDTTKTGGKDGATVYFDALGFRITSDQSCGSPEDTISILPLTDTYDADRLEFVSASPVEDSSSTGGSSPYTNTGTITWNNLGPLYAGQTRIVTVTFKALEPPDNDSDGENDPVTTTDTASSTGGSFLNGDPINDATDDADVTINPTGTIGDIVWNDNGAGGGTSGNGIQDGGEGGIPNVTVWLYDDPNGNGNYGDDGTLIDTQITDATGY